MGANYIDYNVTDETVCPSKHREFYTERLLYMPHCYQTNSFRELYQDILDPAKLPSRADHHLPEAPTFVFCNFCRLGRITPELFAVWMKILKRVPDSVIWLYKHPKAAVSRLQMQATKAGVPKERLIFGSPCSPKLEHLKRVTLADLALDTLVYNGHTTASDMLWAGVPLITKAGDNWPSLVATCIARAAELGELVVNSLKEYEEKAVDLATSPEKLAKLKAKLAKKRLTAPLFDSERWIRDFETGLDEVWRRANADSAQDVGDLLVKNVEPITERMRPVEERLLAPVSVSLDKPVRVGASEGLADRAPHSADMPKGAVLSAKGAVSSARGAVPSAPAAPRARDDSPKSKRRRKHKNGEFNSCEAEGVASRAPAEARTARQNVHDLLRKAVDKRTMDTQLGMAAAHAPCTAAHAPHGTLGDVSPGTSAGAVRQGDASADEHRHQGCAVAGVHEAAPRPRSAPPDTSHVPPVRERRLVCHDAGASSAAMPGAGASGRTKQLLAAQRPASAGVCGKPGVVVPRGQQWHDEVSKGAEAQAFEDGDVVISGETKGQVYLKPNIPKIPKKRKTTTDEVQILEPYAGAGLGSGADPFLGLEEHAWQAPIQELHRYDASRAQPPQLDLHGLSRLAPPPTTAPYPTGRRAMGTGCSPAPYQSAVEMLMGGNLLSESPPNLAASREDEGGESGLMILTCAANNDFAAHAYPARPPQGHSSARVQQGHSSARAQHGRSGAAARSGAEFSLQAMHRLTKSRAGDSLQQGGGGAGGEGPPPAAISDGPDYRVHVEHGHHHSSHRLHHQHTSAELSGRAHSGIQTKWAGGLSDVVHRQRTTSQVQSQVRGTASPGVVPTQQVLPSYPASVQSTGSSAAREQSRQEIGVGAVQGKQEQEVGGVQGGGVPQGLGAPDNGELMKQMKEAIKRKVRALCNLEYRQHFRKQSANEAVKVHLKNVAFRAQNGLIALLARLQPGEHPSMATAHQIQQGLQQLTDDLAYRYACIY